MPDLRLSSGPKRPSNNMHVIAPCAPYAVWPNGTEYGMIWFTGLRRRRPQQGGPAFPTLGHGMCETLEACRPVTFA